MIRVLTYVILFAIAGAIVGPPIVLVAVGGLMLGAGLALARKTDG